MDQKIRITSFTPIALTTYMLAISNQDTASCMESLRIMCSKNPANVIMQAAGTWHKLNAYMTLFDIVSTMLNLASAPRSVFLQLGER